MDLFEAKIDKTPGHGPDGECWVWTGSIGNGGYGRFWKGEKVVSAHREALERCNGPIPDGLIVRHKCDNRPCVNPDHIELGTHKQNTKDAIDRGRFKPVTPKKKKTHCKRGHPLTDDNVRQARSQRGRQCLTCRRAYDRARVRVNKRKDPTQ